MKYFREVARYLDAEPGAPPVPSQGGHGGHGGHGAHGGDDGERREEKERPASINQTCPWTGKLVSADALTRFEGHVVGFHRPEDRDAFERAANIAGAGPVPVRAEVQPVPREGQGPANATCPWSGRPVSAASHAIVSP